MLAPEHDVLPVTPVALQTDSGSCGSSPARHGDEATALEGPCQRSAMRRLQVAAVTPMSELVDEEPSATVAGQPHSAHKSAGSTKRRGVKQLQSAQLAQLELLQRLRTLQRGGADLVAAMPPAVQPAGC